MKFFLSSHSYQFNFTWNDASSTDWQIIKMFFIAAYVNAYAYIYKDCRVGEDALELDKQWKLKGQNLINKAIVDAEQSGLDILDKAIFNPLQKYYTCDFEQEKQQLKAFVQGKISNALDSTLHYLTHLFALIDYFEDAYHNEKAAIEQRKLGERHPIQYIVARLHDRPIGFISGIQNCRSGHVYLRWVNISPSFHGEGLGRRMMEKVLERYDDASGLELYTRKLNQRALSFYLSCGLLKVEKISGKLSALNNAQRVKAWLSNDGIFPPDDDVIPAHHDTYVGFQGRLTERNEIGPEDKEPSKIKISL